MWVLTITYFIFRSTLGPGIEALFPPIVFYMAIFSLAFGNFLYLYYYMLGCAKRKQGDLIKYVFLVPFYWLAMSVAAYISLYKLIVEPHYWAKTKHGLHLKNNDDFFAKKDVYADEEEVVSPPIRPSKSFVRGFKTVESN